MAATPIAVVTGASSGIGAATARTLAAAGFRVVLTARRKDRIEALAAELNEAGHQATAYPLDVTDRAAVDEFATAFRTLAVLVNNAGGALGADPVATGDPADWRQMYETNVIGTLNVTQALLPALTASGDGTIVILSSTAALSSYEGGGGYVAAKHGEHVLAETLRLEIVGTPVRVIEVAPGMVRTEEFATTRFRGDTEKAAKVYAGVDAPLTAEDVADTIGWAVTRPSHVNIDLLVVRPRAQASNTKVQPGALSPAAGGSPCREEGPAPTGVPGGAGRGRTAEPLRCARGSALHAHHLLELRDDLDQILLLVDDLLDRLVRPRNLVHDARVLTALHALGLLLQVLGREAPLRRAPAHPAARAVRRRVERLLVPEALHDVRTGAHGPRNDPVVAGPRPDRALAGDQQVHAVVPLLRQRSCGGRR
ncbi:NADP-dependent 3-hydroxy acid dehydrogenase YdfG [Streptomyces sp. V2I9]|nr:NADP-dependent 3-hydroxy acid dehydrogenase YdfG [Streptomyces sp. V2I9]